MPIRLSELATKSREIQVEFEGEQIAVTYLPGKMTMETQTRVQQAMAMPAGEANSELAEVLAGLVTAWDVLDENGSPLPVTPDTVRVLPLRFVTSLTQGLFADISPNARTASS